MNGSLTFTFNMLYFEIGLILILPLTIIFTVFMLIPAIKQSEEKDSIISILIDWITIGPLKDFFSFLMIIAYAALVSFVAWGPILFTIVIVGTSIWLDNLKIIKKLNLIIRSYLTKATVK